MNKFDTNETTKWGSLTDAALRDSWKRVRPAIAGFRAGNCDQIAGWFRLVDDLGGYTTTVHVMSSALPQRRNPLEQGHEHMHMEHSHNHTHNDARLITDYYMSPAMGHTKGVPFSSAFLGTCPPGSFVTAVSGRHGYWVDSFKHARCSDGSGLAFMQAPGGNDEFWDNSPSGYRGMVFIPWLEGGVAIIHVGTGGIVGERLCTWSSCKCCECCVARPAAQHAHATASLICNLLVRRAGPSNYPGVRGLRVGVPVGGSPTQVHAVVLLPWHCHCGLPRNGRVASS